MNLRLFTSRVTSPEKVEEEGRGIERRGNALVGADHYEDAPFMERLHGAFGTYDEGGKRILQKEAVGLEQGDIIGVTRKGCPGYEHYGVYVGDNCVVHYTSDSSDLLDKSNAMIQKTSLRRFLRDTSTFFILVFPGTRGARHGRAFVEADESVKEDKPATACMSDDAIMADEFIVPDFLVTEDGAIKVNREEIRAKELVDFTPPSFWDRFKGQNYELHSAEETVSRALSKLGERQYNVATNNCEHFALWCKTGVHESHQINRLKSLLGKAALIIMTRTV